MKRPFFEARFYETYYFASCVRNVLHDRMAYMRLLSDFFCDDAHLACVPSFRRFSAFHAFLDFIIWPLLTEDTEQLNLARRQKEYVEYPHWNDMQLDVLPIEEALQYHRLTFTPFTHWLGMSGKKFVDATRDDVSNYLEHLRDESLLDALREHAVRETFHLLFANRHLLLLFNAMVAERVSETIIEDLDPEDLQWFARDGVLRRVGIPQWVKRAVFYHDRGLCGFCRCDLSGLVAAWPEAHFDHIVPLAEGGLNDVSNIQLLCGKCNRKKNRKRAGTSAFYEEWYPMDEECYRNPI